METPKEKETPVASHSASNAKAVHSSESQSTHQPAHHSRISMPWVIALCVSLLVALLAFFWYFQTRSNQTTSLDTASPVMQKMVVGTDPTLQPMEYKENAKLVGYDIDLANALAKELGVPVEYKDIVFDDLFVALDQKKIDMIISAVTINEERKLKFDFSKEYLNAGQIIIAKRTNTTIKSTADLKGKRIATQKGTTNETEALKYTSSNLVISYPDFEQATKALVDGKVDAIFTDLPSAKGITVANPTLKIASDPFTDEYYGIVFRKGDPFVGQINKALKTLEEKGILDGLKQKWLK